MEQPHSADSERRPVSFPGWKVALAAAGLPESERHEFEREIITFLHRCKQLRSPASVAMIKSYLADQPTQGENTTRAALRWFFKAARAAPSPPPTRHSEGPVVRTTTPPKAADDLGSSTWERALIQAMRSRHFLWRIEETYRRWAQRFAQFIAPKTPHVAPASEVGAFLDHLAMGQRASASTQKQAA